MDKDEYTSVQDKNLGETHYSYPDYPNLETKLSFQIKKKIKNYSKQTS